MESKRPTDHEAMAFARHAQPVQPPAATPSLGPHPEEVDPLGNAHKRPMPADERRTLSVLAFAIVAAVIAIPILATVSDSPVVNVFFGLLPLLATLIIDIAVITRHYKPLAMWVVLVVVHALGLAVLYMIDFGLTEKVNVTGAVSGSAIISIVVTLVATLADFKRTRQQAVEMAPRQHVVQFKPERIEEYVQSIEDKVKAINFVIGRVYRASNGGTAHLRERLRIPSDWYNEFQAVSKDQAKTIDEKLERAKVLVRKIRDRLSLYNEKESDVLSHAELANLKNIVRHKDGDDRIITVLKNNDQDPVEHYFASATEFCDRILEELEHRA